MSEKRSNADLPSPPPKKSKALSADEEQDCINNIRVLSADMVEKANSGHPGAPMGCAPIAHVLFGEVMSYSPQHPKFDNRDRFILSNGHACALLYSMLHLTGYNLSMDDLQHFRQLGSKTPGHPENFLTEGVEVPTGPLGQGISNAVGLALSERHLAAIYNRDGFPVVDHFTYVICGDGCLQEGVSSEASSLAGHLQLGKLIVLYDDNRITIDGHTTLSFTEDVGKRYEAYGWQVLTVSDGNDLAALRNAIDEAKSVTNKPTMIKVRTIIGFGSGKADTHGVHGSPLGAKDLKDVKAKFGFNPDTTFEVKPFVQSYFRSALTRGAHTVSAWQQLFDAYSKAHPTLAAEYQRRMAGGSPEGWENVLPNFAEGGGKATRVTSEVVLNALAPVFPELVGGSADLTPSNLTNLKCSGDFQAATPAGRYIRFGVREHGMAAICNGMAAHGGMRPYCATFLNFIGYAMGSVRLSALGGFPVLYIMTHDSIGLGEDGPTHQPIETLGALRALPNTWVIRPADGKETSGAYAVYVRSTHTPVIMALSRQNTPELKGTSIEGVSRGGYVLEDIKGDGEGGDWYPTLTLLSSGTELALTLQAGQKIFQELQGVVGKKAWVRVVSMPCPQLFDTQSAAYKHSVLPGHTPIMSVEAAGVSSWYKYAHSPFGITTFGLSAPAPEIYKHMGFTVDTLAAHGVGVARYFMKDGGYPVAPSLLDFPTFTTPAAHFH